MDRPSLSLVGTTTEHAAPDADEGHLPGLVVLYSEEVRKQHTPLTACTTIVCSVAPSFRDLFEVATHVVTPDNMEVDWLPEGYGTPKCSIATVPDDLNHRLGLFHATMHILIALFRDARDGSHSRAAESRFNAFKAAAGINAVHVSYTPLDIPIYVATMASYDWIHKALTGILSKNLDGAAQVMMTQIHMVAREAQMTTLMAIDNFLKEFDSFLILIPGVIDEIPKFQSAWVALEKAVGSNWVPYAKATRHPEASRLVPSSFPKLASAALYHASQTSSTMRNYRQGRPVAGGIPESKLKEAYKKKLRKSGAPVFTDKQWSILKAFGVTPELLNKLMRSKKHDQNSTSSEDD